MAEPFTRDALRIIGTGLLMALIPIAVWWVVVGADWATKNLICGPMPAQGMRDPAFKDWWRCTSAAMPLLVFVPIAFTGGAALKALHVRSERRDLAREG